MPFVMQGYDIPFSQVYTYNPLQITDDNVYLTGSFSRAMIVQRDTIISNTGGDEFYLKMPLVKLSIPRVQAANDLSVYPNPETNIINLSHASKAQESRYEIYNTSGKLMQQGQVSRTISVQNLTSGLYIIKIQENDKVSFTKWIKE